MLPSFPPCRKGVGHSPEHQNGLLLNNILMNCPDDVGIYLNEAANGGVYHNTLVGSYGIDVRYAASVVDLRNNLMSGTIRTRDGGTATTSSNLTAATPADFDAWLTDPAALDFTLVDGSLFVDQGEALGAVPDDFCANARDDGNPDLGAVEYDADLGPCGPIAVRAAPVPSLQGWGAGLLALLLLGSLRVARWSPRRTSGADGPR